MAPEDRNAEERAAAERYEASRTPAELEGFRYALHETMDLWCARVPRLREGASFIPHPTILHP